MTEKPSISDEAKMENSLEKDRADTEASTANEPGLAKNILSDHKGKLAIGVAATLGLMVFYNWKQKRLSQEDPEAYARVQKITSRVLADTAETKPRIREARREDAAPSAGAAAATANQSAAQGGKEEKR